MRFEADELTQNPAPDWLKELQTLVLRFPQYGVGSDLAALTYPQLRGLYLFLRRLE